MHKHYYAAMFRRLLGLHSISDFTGFMDIWLAMPLSSVAFIVLGLLLLRFKRVAIWFRLFFCIVICIVAAVVVWIWILLRHDYLIVGQNYGRETIWSCQPGVFIPDDVCCGAVFVNTLIMRIG